MLPQLQDFPLEQGKRALDAVPVVIVIETSELLIFFEPDFPAGGSGSANGVEANVVVVCEAYGKHGTWILSRLAFVSV